MRQHNRSVEASPLVGQTPMSPDRSVELGGKRITLVHITGSISEQRRGGQSTHVVEGEKYNGRIITQGEIPLNTDFHHIFVLGLDIHGTPKIYHFEKASDGIAVSSFEQKPDNSGHHDNHIGMIHATAKAIVIHPNGGPYERQTTLALASYAGDNGIAVETHPLEFTGFAALIAEEPLPGDITTRPVLVDSENISDQLVGRDLYVRFGEEELLRITGPDRTPVATIRYPELKDAGDLVKHILAIQNLPENQGNTLLAPAA